MKRFRRLVSYIAVAVIYLTFVGGVAAYPAQLLPLTTNTQGGTASSNGAAASLPAIKAAAKAALSQKLDQQPSADLLVENVQQVNDWAFGSITMPLDGEQDGDPSSYLFLAKVEASSWRAVLSGTSDFSAWAQAAPQSLLSADERRIFGQMGRPLGVDHPLLSLPWATNDTWTLLQGPHGYQSQDAQPHTSLDLAKGSYPFVNATVTAAWSGVAYIGCGGAQVSIYHDDGWETQYFHILNSPLQNGQTVQRGQAIGSTSTNLGQNCNGSIWGNPPPNHVHFTVKHNETPIAIDGQYIGGYVVHDAQNAGQGCLSRGQTNVCPQAGQIYNDGVIGDGAYTPTPTYTPLPTLTPTPPAPATPVLTIPANDSWSAENGPEKLCWQSGGGNPSSYDVVVTARTLERVYNVTTTNTCWQPPITVGSYDGYDWQVRANSSGGHSQWSASRAFWVVASAPQLDTPLNDDWFAENAPNLCWTNSGRGTVSNYNIHVWAVGVDIHQNNYTGTCWQPTQLNGHYTDHGYQWEVQAIGSWGTSDWSTSRVFWIVPSAPRLVSPTDEAVVVQSVQLCWANTGQGAVNTYKVHIEGSNSFVLEQDYSGTCWSPSQLKARYDDYTWKVQAKGLWGTSDWSAESHFSLVPRATPSPTATPTATATNAARPTYTNTPTATPTPTDTARPTYTNTPSSRPTSTPSNTASPTYTNTPSSRPTATSTPTATPTFTPAASTPSPTNTAVPTDVMPPSPTNTPAVTPSSTNTPTLYPSPTNTAIFSGTLTPSPTFTPSSTPSPIPNPMWRRINSPSVGMHDSLNGVAAPSTNTAWAVGNYMDANYDTHPLILYWDGSIWSEFASPSPGANATLNAVAANSESNAWAVGSYYNSTCNCTASLIVHFNGSFWVQVDSPNPSTSINNLSGVTLDQSGNGWAVGSYNDSNCRCSQPLVLRLQGGSWSQLIVTTPGTLSYLISVTSYSGGALAVGSYYDSSGHSHCLVMSYSGGTWDVLTSSDPGTYNYLFSVSASSANDAWAVGSYTDNRGDHALSLHWNGSGWSVVPVNLAADSPMLRSVVAISATQAWAVGGVNEQALILQWTGTAWVNMTVPAHCSNGCPLLGAAAVSSNYIWSVGDYDDQTLVLRYSINLGRHTKRSNRQWLALATLDLANPTPNRHCLSPPRRHTPSNLVLPALSTTLRSEDRAGKCATLRYFSTTRYYTKP